MGETQLLQHVQTSIERTLKKPIESISSLTVLKDVGIDSLLLFRFVTELESVLNISIDDIDFKASNFVNVKSIIETVQKYEL